MQITFVMLIFPLIMNAIQYYIIDSFIKDKSGENYGSEGDDRVEEDENEGLIGAGGRISTSDDDDEDGVVGKKGAAAKVKEANPTPLPTEYDPEIDGAEGSNPPSRRGEVDKK